MGPNFHLPPSPSVLFDQARAAQRSGQWHQAVQLYRRVLDADSGHAGAWQGLGEALQELRQPAEAVTAYQNALRLGPNSVEILFRLAIALAENGRRDESMAAYRQVLQLWPQHAESLANLGVALAEQGDVGQAVDLLRQAVQVRPDFAKAHQNLGVALGQLGRLEEAAACLHEALRLQPDYAEASFNLGNMLDNLGRRQEAIAAYRRAVQLRPDHSGAFNNLGLALTEAGKPGEAVVLLRQAVRLRPQATEAHNNLGLALADLGRFAEAEAAYHEALRLDPRYAEAHSNLGNTLKEQGRFEEALACYQLALLLKPDSASSQYNRALTLLQMGDYEQGWPAYEWRWRRKNIRPRLFGQPGWEGGTLEAKSILLWCEQGLGDTLMFVRYARLVKEKGARVVLECPPSLVPLLSRCEGLDQVVAEGLVLPHFDVQCPLMSLPARFRTTLATVPAAVPYLQVEPERVALWRQRLAGNRSFKVGVVWQGNPRFPWDRFRSIPLRCFAPLAQVAGVELFSLQKGPGKEQLQELGGQFSVMELAEELDAEGGAFLDTAALMKNLDLVVSADTATAHLAGALGVPVWLALPAVSDWRWLRDREETPWYPSMRLFRQSQVGDWRPVLARMAEQLQRAVAAREKGNLVRVEVSPGELLDRLTILQIKSQRIKDAEKLARVRAELAVLRQVREQVPDSEEVRQLEAQLKAVNEILWEAEEGLRLCERAQDFGERFVALARSVYRKNDERARLKSRLNRLLGSALDEPKEYPGCEQEVATSPEL